jgi:hypothetical protein
MDVNLSDIDNLNRQKENAKILLERRQMAIRLHSNRDFRKLIMEGFCLHDAARYVQESADPMLTVEQRADALNMAQASGHLRRYMSLCIQMGAVAERELPEIEETLAAIRSEESAT